MILKLKWYILCCRFKDIRHG